MCLAHFTGIINLLTPYAGAVAGAASFCAFGEDFDFSRVSTRLASATISSTTFSGDDKAIIGEDSTSSNTYDGVVEVSQFAVNQAAAAQLELEDQKKPKVHAAAFSAVRGRFLYL